VFATPPGMEQEGVKDFVKRVIGLPGDRIEARNDQIYINDGPLQEPYINPDCGLAGAVSGEALTAQTIPPDHVFVMGDNRCASKDSRVFGPIPVDTIVGRAFVRIWPLGRFKFL
jgi:signal peptidase I